MKSVGVTLIYQECWKTK